MNKPVARALLVAVMALLSACSGSQGLAPATPTPTATPTVLPVVVRGTASPTATATATLTPTPTPRDPMSELIERAINSLTSVKSYHVVGSLHTVSTDPAGEMVESRVSYEGDVVLPDRYAMKLKLANAGGELEMDVIQIGAKAWGRWSGVFEWEPLPGEASPLAGSDPRASADDLRRMRELTLVGTETVSGYRTQHLRGTFDMSAPTGGSAEDRAKQDLARALIGDAKGTADVWIREDGVIVRQRSKITMSLFGTPTTMTAEMTYSNIGASVDIQPPR